MAIQAAIEATAAFLAGVKDHPNYVEFREQQSSKILLQIRGVSLTMDQGSSLIEAMKSVDWSPAEYASLQSEVMNSVQLCLAGSGRKALQNYTALAAYLPAEVWDELLGSTQSSQAKLEGLLHFAHKLGLSNPTENTFQFICAVFLLATEGQKAMNMQPCIRLETLKMIKKIFKSLVSKWPAGVFPHLQKLPSSVLDLQEAYPNEFARMFGSSAPAPSRLSWSDISVIATGTPMRGTAKTSQLSFSSQMLGRPDMTSVQSVPALLQALAQTYGNVLAHTQPAQLPQLMLLPAAQSRVQAKLDHRLALPSQSSLPPSVPIMNMDALPPPVTAESTSAFTAAASPPASLGDIEAKPKVTQKSVEAAAKVVMEAMSAKSAAAAAKDAKHEKKIKATKGKATKGKATKGKCKTPAPVAKDKNQKKKPLPSNAERLKMRPDGCSKCRRKPGCTPSCFK